MLDFLGFFFGIGSHVSQRSCEIGGVMLQRDSLMMLESDRVVSVCSAMRFCALLFLGLMSNGIKGCGSSCVEELRAERVGVEDSPRARVSDPGIWVKL